MLFRSFYKENLSNIPSVEFSNEPEGSYSNRWLSCILTPSFEHRENIRVALENENIESRPLWKPMHAQPVFEKAKSYVNGVSESLFERGLCLPSGSSMEIEDLERVCNIVKNELQ